MFLVLVMIEACFGGLCTFLGAKYIFFYITWIFWIFDDVLWCALCLIGNYVPYLFFLFDVTWIFWIFGIGGWIHSLAEAPSLVL